MSHIAFEDRAVAFIDVLGFKALVSTASTNRKAFAQLQNLVDRLASAIPTLDADVKRKRIVPKELIPKHIYISDSIILSAPLSVTLQGWSHYSGLEIVVMRTIQLTHLLLKAGYLVRGGIAVGKVWHGNSNIVGPAYQEAHQLEVEGCEPRITLSANAKKHWDESTRGSSRMCIEYDGELMVNGLHDYYIQNRGAHDVSLVFKNYEAIVRKNVNSRTLPKNAIRKWRWFEQYVRAEKDQSMALPK